MASLQIIHKGSKTSQLIPHKVYLNGTFIGILKDKSVQLQGLPEGLYNLKIGSMFPFLYAQKVITIQNQNNIVSFKDKEQFWDILCVIDLILIVLQWFITLNPTATRWYNIFTNGYLILWIIYEWIIRKNYFIIKQIQ